MRGHSGCCYAPLRVAQPRNGQRLTGKPASIVLPCRRSVTLASLVGHPVRVTLLSSSRFRDQSLVDYTNESFYSVFVGIDQRTWS